MRVGIVLLGASAEAAAYVEAHLKRWRDAQLVVAETPHEVRAVARRFQWTALVVASFGCEVGGEAIDFGEFVHPLALEFLTLDPQDLPQAALRLGVKAAKLTRASIVHRAQREAPPPAPSLSRRALFTAPAPLAKEIPSRRPVVVGDKCRAHQGCRKCAQACPFEAIALTDGLPDVTKDCRVCGTCVAVCPTGAMQSPVFSDDEWAGILDGMAASDIEGKTLLLTCARAAIAAPPRGTVVEQLPCVGTLGVTHLTEAAAFGPERVIAWCPRPDDCRTMPAARRMQEELTTVVGNLATGAERLSYIEGADGLTQALGRGAGVPPGSVGRLSGQRRPDFIAALRHASHEKVSPSQDGQLFALAVDESCTLCGACAIACADSALKLTQGTEGLTLDYEQERCIGCGACAARCPERAVHLSDADDISDVLAGRKAVLASSSFARCRGCNAVLGPAATIARLSVLLSSDGAAVDGLSYCPSCKMARMSTGESRQS